MNALASTMRISSFFSFCMASNFFSASTMRVLASAAMVLASVAAVLSSACCCCIMDTRCSSNSNFCLWRATSSVDCCNSLFQSSFCDLRSETSSWRAAVRRASRCRSSASLLRRSFIFLWMAPIVALLSDVSCAIMSSTCDISSAVLDLYVSCS